MKSKILFIIIILSFSSCMQSPQNMDNRDYRVASPSILPISIESLKELENFRHRFEINDTSFFQSKIKMHLESIDAITVKEDEKGLMEWYHFPLKIEDKLLDKHKNQVIGFKKDIHSFFDTPANFDYLYTSYYYHSTYQFFSNYWYFNCNYATSNKITKFLVSKSSTFKQIFSNDHNPRYKGEKYNIDLHNEYNDLVLINKSDLEKISLDLKNHDFENVFLNHEYILIRTWIRKALNDEIDIVLKYSYD